MTDAVIVIGAGPIGQAIARRIGVGKPVLLVDLRQYDVSTATIDVSSRGSVHALVQTAPGPLATSVA